MVGNDAAPEFSAKILPAGSAPASKTYQPNPVNETPGQADNDLAGRSHGKEDTTTSALDTLGGATSADVHTGYGHPGSGQTSSEIRHEGKSGRDRERLGLVGQAGGSGVTGEESIDIKRLQKDHQGGHITEREHNVSLDGAESRVPVQAEQVASEAGKVKQGDYDRAAEKPPGHHS